MAWFDPHAADYDAFYDTPLGRYVDEVEKAVLADMARPVAGELALDIGCGTGAHTLWLAEQRLHVTGLDESAAMLGVARAKSRGLDPAPEWLHADAGSLPFGEGRFDLVVSVAALEFVDEPTAVVREAERVLRPGGRLVMGLLVADSAWGEAYRADGAAHPDGIFAAAHFFDEHEATALLSGPYVARRALYHPPQPDLDRAAADRLERAMQQRQADGAGFLVVRWDKGAA